MPTNPWDERYGQPGYAYGTEPNDHLRACVHHLRPGGRVLCVADGEGRNGVFLAEHGIQVTSVDLSAVGLAKAQRLAQERNVTITTVHADLAHYDLGTEQWDAVVSVFCHLPTDLRRGLHARIVRALRPGGYVILEAYTPAQLDHRTGGPPTADLMMRASDLRQEFAGLEILTCTETTREIHEGRLHNGTSAVVQFLAQRQHPTSLP